MNDVVIGGSDIRRLIEGDWYILYREKMGIQPKKPFADSIHSALGVLTEDFHAEVLLDAISQEKDVAWDLIKPEARQHHPLYRYRVAQIDRLLKDATQTEMIYPVELKFPHHTRWYEDRLDAYYAQVQWQMLVTSSPKAIFSCLWIDRHEWNWIEQDLDYQGFLIEVCDDFMWHIENATPPKRSMKL